MLKCHGKCYLAKKLREAESENQQDVPVSVKHLEESAPFFISTFDYTIPFKLAQKAYQPASDSRYIFCSIADIFKPPCS